MDSAPGLRNYSARAVEGICHVSVAPRSCRRNCWPVLVEIDMRKLVRSLLAPMLVLLCGWSTAALSQSLPVAVTVSKNIAAIRIGLASNPVADMTLTFDDASGLSVAS